MPDELKVPFGCPFCGNIPDVYMDEYIEEWFVDCKPRPGRLCPVLVVVGPYPTRSEAVAAWNMRTDHRPLPALVYDLFEARREMIRATKNFPSERPTKADIKRAKKRIADASKRHGELFEQLRQMAEEVNNHAE